MAKQQDRQIVANRLREARGRIFDSAADAARALAMKAVTVRAHESGQNGVSYHDLDRYARRYGVDVRWLLTGEGPQEPQLTHYFSDAQYVPIWTEVQDGAWIPDDSDLFYPTKGVDHSAENELDEMAVYTDPRFPAEQVYAVKVVCDPKIDGPYINGTVVFTVQAYLIGWNDGDHVIVVRTRGGFCEWTIRRVERRPDEVLLHALHSSEPPFEWAPDAGADPYTDVVGVVIGSATRRPVNTLRLEERRQIELEALSEQRRGKRAGPIVKDDEHLPFLGVQTKP